MGGRGSSSKFPTVSYPAFPVRVRIMGGAGASAEDKAQKRAIVTRFMSEAKEGNVYSLGAGIMSGGGEQFEIVRFNRSPNKLGIRSNGRTIALSRSNAAKYIMNGATLIRKK